jgi:hypothetical protein
MAQDLRQIEKVYVEVPGCIYHPGTQQEIGVISKLVELSGQ